MSEPCSVLLFDGDCNVCAAWVRFVAPRDPRGRIAFAALQSPVGRALARRHGLDADALDTMILVEQRTARVRSDAVLGVLRQLAGPWPLVAGVGSMIPRLLRDHLYDALARRRLAWFGRGTACLVPDASLRARFLASEHDGEEASP